MIEFYTLDSGVVPLDIIKIHKPKLIQILNSHPKGHFWPCTMCLKKPQFASDHPVHIVVQVDSSQSIGLALSLLFA